ncbi:ROP interactive partner 3 isoform 2 [Hibiscus syriacus]|uniref:ROP interactive partner 3 isoform 2 n=1 Tax=Hibiscus syriacus TaxID=106335 RepID=A0A6A3BVY0_HIBSY|nr:ROP interactive partner 3 isoform 2 [Hibiscus syriacus]
MLAEPLYNNNTTIFGSALVLHLYYQILPNVASYPTISPIVCSLCGYIYLPLSPLQIMQTPKSSKTGSLVVSQKKSSAAPRTSHRMKMSGSDADMVSSLNPASKTRKERSPKVNERKALRSPVSEKKCADRVNELEAQLNQLQDDLKRTKDQLTASESWKRRAMQEAEEAKKQLSEMSAKLEEYERQLLETSASEDDRVQELRKICQDRDRAWQSEIEAVQKQQEMDSAALASALNEIQKLKVQLEKSYESEAIRIKHAEAAHSEIQNLRIELTDTLALVDKLKSEITNCRESEAQAIEVVNKTKMQIEAVNKTGETLRSNATKGTEANKKLSLELGESKAKVKSLEGLVSKLQEELVSNSSTVGEKEETEKLKTELNFAKLEVGQLRSALDAYEIRYQEEYIRSTLQIRSVYEKVECIRTQSSQKESELEAELKKMKADVEELRANLMDKETELQCISAENEELNSKMEKQLSNEKELELAMELKKLEADLVELQAHLTAKEIELQSALMKLGNLTEAAEKSSKRAELVTEQLERAQAANNEMGAELRRIKVQSDQWRKAAEAATATLSTGNNGKHMDQIISFDSNHNPISGSPNSEDMGDDSPKKKKWQHVEKDWCFMEERPKVDENVLQTAYICAVYLSTLNNVGGLLLGEEEKHERRGSVLSLFALFLFLPWLLHCTCDDELLPRLDASNRTKVLKYKLVVIASILMVGALGVSLPILAKKIPMFQSENNNCNNYKDKKNWMRSVQLWIADVDDDCYTNHTLDMSQLSFGWISELGFDLKNMDWSRHRSFI